MRRVVVVYTLLLMCICGILVIGAKLLGAIIRRDALTFLSYSRAFGSSDVFSIDLITGGITQLTHDGDIYDYAWSPDGMLLVVGVDRIGLSPYIDILDWRGSRVTALGNEPGVISPIWRSDSETLIFHYLGHLQPQIFAVQVHDIQNWHLLADGWYEDATISPDGTAVVYVSDGSGGGGMSILDLDTGELEAFIAIGSGPIWSPDGEWVAYSSYDDDIYVVNVQDQITHQLTYMPSFESQPAWSLDNSQIAFVASDDNDSEIYIMNTDGSNVRQVTFNDVNDRQPVWSPDGSQIAFVAADENDSEIFIMNADGSDVRQLTFNDVTDTDPAWVP
jgi:Tol biopolymer transport system component